MTTPRFKNVSGVIIARNDADTDEADFVAKSLKLTGGAHVAGRVLTEDASGLAAWVVNPAIAAAATAQTTADGAVSTNTSQSTAITAAQTDATAALAAAAAAQATADAASPLTRLHWRGHFHSEEQAVITGTEARNTDATYPFCGGKYTTTQNAVIEHYFTCRAGSHFIVSALSQKSSVNGIVTVYLDGTLIHTEDCYAVATDKAFVFGQTIGAITAGDHTLAFKCLTHNGSSTGYIMYINFVKWTVTP